MYFYKSVVGLMTISRRKDGLFHLFINDEYCGKFPTAGAAADSVAQFNTNYFPWDKLMYSCPFPLDLSEWHLHR